jgi:hypothetical protein
VNLALCLAVAMLLYECEIARADRAGDALFLDGGQEPFNSTDPPSPGFVYLTPRKTSRGLPPWVSIVSCKKRFRIFLRMPSSIQLTERVHSLNSQSPSQFSCG